MKKKSKSLSNPSALPNGNGSQLRPPTHFAAPDEYVKPEVLDKNPGGGYQELVRESGSSMKLKK